MKIAVFGDIHGNFYGLKRILDDIKKERPEKIYCTGDLFIPFPGTNRIWSAIEDFKITCVRGNGEDRLIQYYAEELHGDLHTSIKYKPTQFIGNRINPDIIDIIKGLPLTIFIQNPLDTKIILCHGTPFNNQDFLIHPYSKLQFQDLELTSADIIIAGHSHVPYKLVKDGIQLITVGSGGLSFNGEPFIHYLILEFKNDKWQFKFKSLMCDYDLLINDLIELNFLDKVAPLSWLILDELLCYQDRVYNFFIEFYPKVKPETLSEWEKAIVQFLKEKDRWNAVKRYL